MPAGCTTSGDVAGGASLVYLGVRTIRSADRPAREYHAGAASRSRAQAFRFALMTDLSNPKAAAYFTSLFAAGLPRSAPVRLDVAAILSVVAVAARWYSLVACAGGKPSVVSLYRRARRALVRGRRRVHRFRAAPGPRWPISTASLRSDPAEGRLGHVAAA